MTKSHIRFTLGLLVSLACAAPAAAEEPADDGGRGEVTSYRFDDDLVAGDTVQPNLEVLHARKRGERNSLVRARPHFIPELLKSAADL